MLGLIGCNGAGTIGPTCVFRMCSNDFTSRMFIIYSYWTDFLRFAPGDVYLHSPSMSFGNRISSIENCLLNCV